MSDPSKKDPGLIPGLPKEDLMKAAVAALALIHEAKQAGVTPDGPSPPPLAKELLTDLVKLHVSTIGEIAKINASYTDKMVDFLKKRRAAQSPASGKPGPRALAILKMGADGSPATGKFQIENEAKEERSYRLPSFVELVSLQDGTPGAYAEVGFVVEGKPARSVKVGACAAEGPRTVEVSLSIKRNELLEKGRYRACVSLEGVGSAPGAELIVELIVEPQKEV
ncbi:MAG: hypothetical protein QM820_45695 [Minicystis sp.]